MFENKRRRKYGYDYAEPNLYFITTNVKQRLPAFGIIENGKMHLSRAGEIINKQIHWLESHYDFVSIHEHVVMPDHIHLIIELHKELHIERIKSISELMGALKSTATRKFREHDIDVIWQRSFHDRIIRNEREYLNVVNYIRTNPERWGSPH